MACSFQSDIIGHVKCKPLLLLLSMSFLPRRAFSVERHRWRSIAGAARSPDVMAHDFVATCHAQEDRWLAADGDDERDFQRKRICASATIYTFTGTGRRAGGPD